MAARQLLDDPANAADPAAAPLDLASASTMSIDAVLEDLHSRREGLTEAQAAQALLRVGPNLLEAHGVQALRVLARQFNNPLLVLLGATALASLFFGEKTDAVIILAIVVLSVGLGFVNEYRSERSLADLRARVHHSAIALRDGGALTIDVARLVPGDVVLLGVGDIVPADVRLIEAHAMECDEAVLTGESMPAEKVTDVQQSSAQANSPNCAYMGTIVRAGAGRGVIVQTGAGTAFGRIAKRLGEQAPQTAFQRGLRDFSTLLIQITAVFSVVVFVVNLILHRPLFESLLFALAIAVAITPQLLPAIVTISLSVGAKRMASKSVVVKRLLSIEDLGNVEILITDKTGTLTEGAIELTGAYDLNGAQSLDVLRLGLLCNGAVTEAGQAVGGNALDIAILKHSLASRVGTSDYRVLAQAPFDFERRRMSAIVEGPDGRRTIVTKGAPESVLACCREVPDRFREDLADRFAAGERLIAVAAKDAPGVASVLPADECDLRIVGLLAFSDPPKLSAAGSMKRLRDLGIEVKLATGDNEQVAQKICADLGIEVQGTMTGEELAAMDDAKLRDALPVTTIFARVAPEQKSRLIRALQLLGHDVGYLGDGVNDAVAMHFADVGISVDSGADVAKDAADIVLLDKDLGILADGVVEGRRIFANTIKYVLMGTSSNFGNMISTGSASLFLSFLPMLPSQILLNNMLYDAGELAIPTDNVDEELLVRPARWDMRLIRRFMMLFGPINALFDFTIFAVMLWWFHAGPSLFRSGFFIESFLTQMLVIFAIRTRRVPFFRSRASAALTVTTLACAAIGVALPFSPLAGFFGFAPLPIRLFTVLMLIIVTAYFALVESAKLLFWRPAAAAVQLPPPPSLHARRMKRMAWRFRHRPLLRHPSSHSLRTQNRLAR